MRAKNAILIAAALLLFFSSANALWCGEGDTGGKLLGFTLDCFGRGEIILSCGDGSDRGQCFKRQSCDVGGCEVGTTGRYLTNSCRGNCGDTNTTSVSIVCEPLPTTDPVINLPNESYTGYLGQEFTIEGFAGDAQMIKDIYFEDVESCDINHIAQDFNTMSASVKAVFTCSRLFSDVEITLVAKDYCNAVSTETALLSIEEYCPRDCATRNYPKCTDGVFFECIERRKCAFLEETNCEFGCDGNTCCAPSSCQELGFECGLATGSCDENVSCGTCPNDANCTNNKCPPPPQTTQPTTQPVFENQAGGFDLSTLIFYGPIVAVILVILFIVKKVLPRGDE